MNARAIEQDNGSIRIVTVVERIGNNTTEHFILTHDFWGGDSLEKNIDFAFAETPEGTVHVVYYAKNQVVIGATVPDNDGNHTNISLMSIKDNAVYWKENIRTDGSSLTCGDIKIFDNEIVIGGNLISSEGKQLLAIVADPDNGKEVSRVSCVVEGLGNHVCISFTKNDSNNYVFTGYKTTDVKSSDIFFAEVSEIGNLVKTNTFGCGGDEVGMNKGCFIEYIGNGDYFLFGELEPITNTDICLFKLN